MQGVDRITVFVKATFALRLGTSAELSSPLEVVREDRHRDGWGSLEEATETAPYLPSAGVIARGHACAPEGHAVTSLRVRLALYQKPRWTLNKVLHVFGDRTRSAPNPQAFQRMPIIYERSYGARHMEANPVGQGSGEVLPNILDPAEPARPAGFGPIAKQWTPRKHFEAWSGRIEGGAELNPAFDFRYFHAAPPDQQIDFLRGDEWIFLEGMHPRLPSISSSLPSARGAARLYRTGRTGAHDPGEPVALVADTLVIDADRLICSVVWRGNAALRPGDMPARLRVLAGVELPGRPIPWPIPEAPRPAAVNPAAQQEPGTSGETLHLPSGAAQAFLGKPVAPFPLAEAAPKSAPSSNAIPGAPWSPGNAAPSVPRHKVEVGDETLALPIEAIKRQRATLGAETANPTPLGSTGTELVMSRALPFTPAAAPPPRPEAASTPIPPGLPFAHVAQPPPRAEPASTPRPPVLPFAHVAQPPPRAEPASTPRPPGLPFTPAEPPAQRSEIPPSVKTTGLPFTPIEHSPSRPEPVAPASSSAPTGEAPPRFPEPPSFVQAPAPSFEPASSKIPEVVAAPPESRSESAARIAATEPPEEPAPPAFFTPPAQALVEPPAAELPAPPPLFVLGKTPEPTESAPPAKATPSIPPPPPAMVGPSIPPPPPSNATPSIPPPPPAMVAPSIPPPPPSTATPSIPPPEDAPSSIPAPRASAAPPPPAGAPPGEAEGKDLRAKVLARLKRGEALHDIELAGAELEGVDFSGALLERRSLSGSNLARCNFTGAKLTGADLRGADLTDAILADAELTGANLSRATLDRARLHGATLSNADLSVAKGSGASFEGASLKGVNLKQARLPKGVFNSADLSGANAGKADFSQSSFVKANLSGSSLRDAKLKQATLAGANVDRADLRDADLTGSNVHDVNLAAAKTNGAILRDLNEEPPPDWPGG
jgi:uncharacterized protein YjbI with pentapeptide repeats